MEGDLLFDSKISERFRNDIIEGRLKCIIADNTTPETCPFCDAQIKADISEWIIHFVHHTGECQLRISADQHTGPLYGFMCPGCYYTKLNKQLVIEHITNKHKINGNLCDACVKFELLLTASTLYEGLLCVSYFKIQYFDHFTRYSLCPIMRGTRSNRLE